MPLTVPGEYTGPMSRTGWIQFNAISGYTTMRLRCLENSLPLMSAADRLVRANVLSLSTLPVSLQVEEAQTDQFLVTETIAGSTTTVIKTSRTNMVVNAYAGSVVQVAGTETTVASNTATDLTLSNPLATAPGVEAFIRVWSDRTIVTTTPASPVVVTPGGFVKFTFTPTKPVIEFWTASGPATGSGSVRIQLESILRFEIVPFAKYDPFYPKQPIAATYPLWSSL